GARLNHAVKLRRSAGVGAPSRDRTDADHDRKQRCCTDDEGLSAEAGSGGNWTAAGKIPGGEFGHRTPGRT
ncbi:hypothetical protein KXV85_005027, partial [Aspergillus fumigatus]